MRHLGDIEYQIGVEKLGIVPWIVWRAMVARSFARTLWKRARKSAAPIRWFGLNQWQ